MKYGNVYNGNIEACFDKIDCCNRKYGVGGIKFNIE